MCLGEYAQHIRRRADKPDLPAGEREDLARRADLDAALAHAGHRDQRNVAAPVEHDVLPHLVAHRDGIKLLAVARQQLEILAREHGGGWVERIIEQHHARLRGEGARELFLIEAPMRRLEPHEAWHAPCPLHQREVRVVERLEQHHLVARLDQRHQRASDRLGRAGGDHDLAVGVEVEILPMLVVRGDRLAQLGQPHHRRILVPAVDDRVGRLCQHIFGKRAIGKTLPQVDGVVLAREPRHHLEHRNWQIGENGVHKFLNSSCPAMTKK
jgi:hypothetical protein